MTPEELEELTRPSPIQPLEDPWLKDIPEIADHALGVLNRIQELKEIQGLSFKEIAEKEREKRKKDDEEYKKSLPAKLDGLNRTHFGNAERFIVRFGQVVRYCPPFDWWYVWVDDEGRWLKDERGIVQELGKSTVLKIYDEAAIAPTPDQRKALSNWAVHCETPGSVGQMLDVARSVPGIVVMPDAFDQENHLINIQNGYYDLAQHSFIPHDREHFFSMMLPFDYDPDALCPQWLAFLNRIFKSNPEREKIINFLQRAVGYTLTGDTSERAVFMMYGLGANGKSVFIGVLKALFGDYGASVSSSCFTTAMSTNVRNDLARLVGKRFVSASENSSNTVLDEETIKSASGGVDNIVCRFLFKEEFEYKPNFKIWWVFNHKPKIKDTTDSIWDRIHLIPCEERIPVEEQDKHLSDKLVAELPGIFNWAITGLKEFQRVGLLAPATVKEATKEYRNDEDTLHDFLEEYFEIQKKDDSLSPDWRVPFRDIYDLYKAWSLDQGFKDPWSKRRVGMILGDRFKQARTDHGRNREYIGLRIKGQRSLGDRTG